MYTRVALVYLKSSRRVVYLCALELIWDSFGAALGKMLCCLQTCIFALAFPISADFISLTTTLPTILLILHETARCSAVCCAETFSLALAFPSDFSSSTVFSFSQSIVELQVGLRFCYGLPATEIPLLVPGRPLCENSSIVYHVSTCRCQ